jgi:hypothetical protein
MGLDFFIAYAMGRSSAARAERAAASLPAVSGVSIDAVEDLSERINRLVLMSAAMWSIMEDNGATEKELMTRMQEIDAADGVTDGRMTPQAHRCAKCDAMVAPGLTACQFCGEPLPEDDAAKPFDSL